MKSLSKSRYTLFRQCPKALWQRIYNPDTAKEKVIIERILMIIQFNDYKI